MNNEKKEKKAKTKKIVIYVILALLVIGIMAVTYDLLVLKSKPAEEPVAEEQEQAEEVVEATDVVESKTETEIPPSENTAKLSVELGTHTYSNNGVLQCEVHDGLFMNVGVEAPEDSRMLFINPKCYIEGDEYQSRYGFYVTPENGAISFSGAYQLGSVSSDEFNGINSFVVMNRTLDTLRPAEYISADDFGVEWEMFNPEEPESSQIVDTIRFRIIDLDKGILVGAARAEISYDADAKTYYFSNLYSSDVQYTGEVTAEMRDYLIKATKAFFSGGAKEFTVSLPEDRWAEMMDKATVEVTPKTYFKQLYNIRSNAIRSSAINKYELIAVNIPYEGYVVFTAYFTPQYNVSGPGSKIEWADNIEYRQMLIAYDALCPYSKTTFIDNLYPEDVEFFTTYFFDDEEEEQNSDVEVVSVDVAEDDAYSDGSQVITGSEIVDDEVTVNEPVIIINN